MPLSARLKCIERTETNQDEPGPEVQAGFSGAAKQPLWWLVAIPGSIEGGLGVVTGQAWEKHDDVICSAVTSLLGDGDWIANPGGSQCQLRRDPASGREKGAVMYAPGSGWRGASPCPVKVNGSNDLNQREAQLGTRHRADRPPRSCESMASGCAQCQQLSAIDRSGSIMRRTLKDGELRLYTVFVF